MTDVSVKRATWLELLYDVAFVALIAQLTYLAADHYTSWLGLVHVFIIGYTIFLAWWSATVNRNLQERETTVDKLLVQVQLGGAFLMSLTMPGVFAGEYLGYFMVLALVRVLQIVMTLRLYRLHPHLNPPTKNIVQGIAVGAVLWLISGLAPDPYHFIFAGAALIIDVCTPLTQGKGNTVRLLNVHHLQERLGLFFMLVLGESLLVVALTNTSASLNVFRPTILFSGISIIIALWWLYFEYLERCASGRRPKQLFLYLHAHGFLFGFVVLLAAAMKNLLKYQQAHQSDIALYITSLVGIAICLFIIRSALKGVVLFLTQLKITVLIVFVCAMSLLLIWYGASAFSIVPLFAVLTIIVAIVDWHMGKQPQH